MAALSVNGLSSNLFSLGHIMTGAVSSRVYSVSTFNFSTSGPDVYLQKFVLDWQNVVTLERLVNLEGWSFRYYNKKKRMNVPYKYVDTIPFPTYTQILSSEINKAVLWNNIYNRTRIL